MRTWWWGGGCLRRSAVIVVCLFASVCKRSRSVCTFLGALLYRSVILGTKKTKHIFFYTRWSTYYITARLDQAFQYSAPLELFCSSQRALNCKIVCFVCRDHHLLEVPQEMQALLRSPQIGSPVLSFRGKVVVSLYAHRAHAEVSALCFAKAVH